MGKTQFKFKTNVPDETSLVPACLCWENSSFIADNVQPKREVRFPVPNTRTPDATRTSQTDLKAVLK